MVIHFSLSDVWTSCQLSSVLYRLLQIILWHPENVYTELYIVNADQREDMS